MGCFFSVLFHFSTKQHKQERKMKWLVLLLICLAPAIDIADSPDPPSVALVSFPNSGTTWLKFLYEAITGLQSCSVYGEPVGIIKTSKPPEEVGAPHFIKDHYPYLDHGLSKWFVEKQRKNPMHYAKRIVRLKRNKQSNIHSRLRYDPKLDPTRVSREYDVWNQFWDNNSHLGDRLLTVEYESLLNDTITEIRRVIAFVLDLSEDSIQHTPFYNDERAFYVTHFVYPPKYVPSLSTPYSPGEL
jgi:hypothetical protein